MSDPIERMQRLRSDVEGGPMPPASEVRRRGDRLRRRRTAAMTAGAALAVVAIVTPVAFLTGGDPSGESPHDPVDTPSETHTSAPAYTATLTGESLLRDADTVFNDQIPWTRGESGPECNDNGCAEPPSWCIQSILTGSDLGAAAAFQRTWFVDSGIHHLTQAVAEFPSADDATAAYDQLTEWLVECPARDAAEGYTATAAPVEIPVDGEAQLVTASYDLDPEGTAEQGGEAYYQIEEHVGLVVSGNRLTLLLQGMPDGDPETLEFPAPVPVEQMLPTAAERLVLDGETDQPSTEWRTDIPADFPIDRDLSAPEGDPISGPGGNAVGINPLNICGDGRGVHEAEWPRDFVERLAASAPGPAEYLDARELITLPDVQEAQGVLAGISSQVEDCSPLGDGQVWTIHDGRALGEETLYLSRTLDFGLGGDVYVFVRVGNAVLAVDIGGEWELESTVPAGIEDVADTAAAIIPEMCIYSADSC